MNIVLNDGYRQKRDITVSTYRRSLWYIGVRILYMVGQETSFKNGWGPYVVYPNTRSFCLDLSNEVQTLVP